MSKTALANRNNSSAKMVSTAAEVTVLVVVIVVGVSAAVLSYAGLYSLSVRSGVDPALAFLVPICIDGLMIAGAVTVTYATLTKSSLWFGWSMTLMGVSLSVYGNAASVPGDGYFVWQARLVHSVAPLSLVLCVESLLFVLRQRAEFLIAQESTERKLAQRALAGSTGGASRGRKSATKELDGDSLARARELLSAGASYSKIAEALPIRTRSGWHRILSATNSTGATN